MKVQYLSLNFIFAIAKYSDWEKVVPFCEVAPVKCSLERNDDAFMPYYDSRCYCDYFCYRNDEDHDCCPDFEYVCNPTEPPNHAKCEWNGRIFNKHDHIMDDCNKCVCIGDHIQQWTCEKDICANDERLINEINGEGSWSATKYNQWNQLKYVKLMSFSLGTIMDAEEKRRISNYNNRDADAGIYTFQPDDEWTASRGGWKIGQVRDQGKCGSSWALSALDVSSDRIGEKNEKIQLSLQHLLSCSENLAKDSCRAGRIHYAWGFLREFGVTEESEYPYESGRTQLIGRCTSPDDINLRGNKHHQFSPAYKISTETLQIKYELFERGPVQATFLVCPDFYQYRTGVYKRTWTGDASMCDYHSVRVVGWGKTEVKGKIVEYWHCINSWGSDWGENGHFKIEIGDSEINDYMISTWGRNSNNIV